MANLTSVDITSGIPTSGTGTVATINALQADGGMVTIGAKADAKSIATDTTAITAMSVWKQISASVQLTVTALGLLVYGAGTAAAALRTTLASDDPAVAALGATTGAKVVTDSNGTIQQYLRGLVTMIAAGISVSASAGQSARSVTGTITPANSSHAAGDAVGDSGTSAIMTFAALFNGAGEHEITDIIMDVDHGTAIASGFILELHGSSPTAINDDAAWSLASGDLTKHLASIPIGTPEDKGSVQKVHATLIGKRITAAGTAGYGILVNNTTVTLAAAAIRVTIKTVPV